MSELTPCNYCNMKHLKERAKKEGKRVVRIPSAKMQHMGGEEIHLVRKDEPLSGDNWVAWMALITDHCVC